MTMSEVYLEVSLSRVWKEEINFDLDFYTFSFTNQINTMKMVSKIK